jgi:murein DD-endopeptidase MepM/ murein hydrolase activator NlpD
LKGRTSGERCGRWRTGLVASTALAACVSAGIGASGGLAASSDGSAPTGGAAAAGHSRSTSLKLRSEHAKPEKIFYDGKRRASYRFSIGGTEPRNLKIQAVNRRNWRVVRTWTRERVEPGRVHAIRWSGSGKRRRPVPAGHYVFRVRGRHGATANRSRVKGDDRSFGVFPNKFPVRARHSYGDGYGAPRSGHIHQGQDILARCGKRLVAARGGRVQYRGYQAGGAGYYLVVDGKRTGHDYVYMHLRRRGRPKRGHRVRTGQRIGFVGRTGDASACHLHFEMWTKPGWYEGGHAMRSVTRHLKYWDRWS